MRYLISILFFLSLCSGRADASSQKGIPDSSRPGTTEMIPVPEGCFQMGNTFGDGYYMERPVHEVCLSAFAIGEFSVTRGDFKKFAEETGYRSEAEKSGGCYIYDGIRWVKDPASSWRFPGFLQQDNHPVVCVSWNDSIAYAEWLTGKMKRQYRLPTEAEWEYAARSGGKQEKYAGSDDVDSVAWYSRNSGNRTHPVGSKQPNDLGLYDMSGNVWQWTADWYNERYYRESPINNPQGPNSGSKRIFRGGSWFSDQRGVRTTYRDFHFPSYASSYLGFRLVSPRSDQ